MRAFLLVVILVAGSLSGFAADLVQQPLFVQGEGGYNNYRIPALLATQAGTLLAFCEAREAGDSSDIDLVLRRSEDGGTTWSETQVVWDDGPNVCGNPCVVQDQETGVIWLLLTWNDSKFSNAELHEGRNGAERRVYVASSEDDGRTWSVPRDITATAKAAEWDWYATGPGVGIQLAQGTHVGRLVIPCDYTASGEFGAHVIYSDDHGATWQMGGTVGGGTNECQVVELEDGALLLNMRMQRNGEKLRGVARSTDGGASWSALEFDETLIEPVCQASLIRYQSEDGAACLLFSNPASREGRVNMTVRLSRDEGETWPVARQLHAGPSAYSSLAALPDGAIGCLYEGGETLYGEIVFAKFPMEWLLEGGTP